MALINKFRAKIKDQEYIFTLSDLLKGQDLKIVRNWIRKGNKPDIFVGFDKNKQEIFNHDILIFRYKNEDSNKIVEKYKVYYSEFDCNFALKPIYRNHSNYQDVYPPVNGQNIPVQPSMCGHYFSYQTFKNINQLEIHKSNRREI